MPSRFSLFFFFNDTATTEIYTLSLHDALPIYLRCSFRHGDGHDGEDAHAADEQRNASERADGEGQHAEDGAENLQRLDRKSTRLNSSHLVISYAVFCLKKKKNNHTLPASITNA